MKKMMVLAFVLSLVVACADDDFTISSAASVAETDTREDTGKFGGGHDSGVTVDSDGEAAPSDTTERDSADAGGADGGGADSGSADADSGMVDSDSLSTSTAFPTAYATAYCKLNGTGSPFTLGYCKDFGDYVEEQVAHSSMVTKVTFDVPVYSSMTTSPTTCGIGITYRFDAFVGAVRVGELSFVGEPESKVVRMKGSFSIAPIVPVSGKLKLRIETKTTVCDGGGSWKWSEGGKVVFE